MAFGTISITQVGFFQHYFSELFFRNLPRTKCAKEAWKQISIIAELQILQSLCLTGFKKPDNFYYYLKSNYNNALRVFLSFYNTFGLLYSSLLNKILDNNFFS